jgi:hypothetical protein
LPAVGEFIAGELFIRFKIDDGPAIGLLKGEIDYTLDESAAWTASDAELTSSAGAPKMRP